MNEEIKGNHDVEIKTLKLEDIIPYEKNPRNNEPAVDAVAESIKHFGYRNLIMVDEENVILGGHTRLLALKKLGIEEVPCEIVRDLSESEKIAFRLADNKTAELAEWDFDLLADELLDCEIDMSLFGFEIEELEEETEVVEDDYTEEVESRCKEGDMWQLGRHTLLCGDSTDINSVERLVGGVTIDLVLTDPPYNVAITGRTEDELTIQNDDMVDEDFIEFLQRAFYCISHVLKDGGAFYIWHASRTQREFETALNDNGLTVREQLIWNKNSMVLGRQDYQWKHEPCFYGWKDGASHNWYSDRSQTTVIDMDRPTRNAQHPTMKPVALFDYQIRNSSKKGENILDLFGGSGTTVIACEQNGRNAYVMELDPHYCDVIINRWEELTGERAVLLND